MVQQCTGVELLLNLKATKALALHPPIPLPARTAKVIEEEPDLLQCMSPSSAGPIGALLMTHLRH